MIVAALHSPAARSLAGRAAQLAGAEPRACVLDDVPRVAAAVHGRLLLVHDFAPDAAQSVELLERVAYLDGRLAVFALLEAPATPALDLLAVAPRSFALCGVALAAEMGARPLADRFRVAHQRHGRRVLLDVVASCWGLDPALARLAERELTADRPYGTLAGLLRGARMGRRRFVRLARSSRMVPPLRFLQALHALEAADLLQHGATLEHAAQRLGYGSPDTLRRHFHTVMGIVPHEARDIPLRELACRCVRGDTQAAANHPSL